MRSYVIQRSEQTDTGLTYSAIWSNYAVISGYLDLLSGGGYKDAQNAFVRDSTHILITRKYKAGITDQMRIIDEYNHFYLIDYVDNPVSLNHHNELYLTYGGEL